MPWITTGELREREIFSTAKRVSPEALSQFSALRVFPKGSVAIAMYGATIGRLGILGVDATTNQACCVLPSSSVLDNRYLYYWFQAVRDDIINLASGGGQPNISQAVVASLRVSCPPDCNEQTQIAKFLDYETAKIDALIDKQQQLIALLKEKRQAVISHAVTKGLNPNAPMKDSGVEWLGEVPAHWEVCAIKRLSPVKRGASPRPIDEDKYFDEEGEYAWTRIADVTASDMYLKSAPQRLSALGSSLSVKLEPGSLFLSIAATVGKPCIAGIRACIHDGFVYFPELELSPFFLFRVFEAGQAYKGLGKMGTQLNLNTDTVGAIKIAVPPPQEVQKIVAYLELELGKLDRLMERQNTICHILQERRTALISAAVTGKIDVRHWQPPKADKEPA
jgi:type I restriction enzyme S subunit